MTEDPRTEDARRKIHRFIAELAGEALNFSDDDNLVERGLVQSIRLLELVDFVADNFGVEATADDLYRGSFASVNSILRFIAGARP